MRPWPATDNLLEIPPPLLLRCLEEAEEGVEDHAVFVSEKLDGSNVSVDSEATMSSRRCTLVQGEEAMAAYTFSGCSLEKLLGTVTAARRLRDTFLGYLGRPPSGSGAVLTIYGELILEGTATGKADKFNYRGRGFERGTMHAFGVAVEGQCQEEEDDAWLDALCDQLLARGFACRVRRQEAAPSLLVLLNDALERALSEAGARAVPTRRMALSGCFAALRDELNACRSEGVVITFPKLCKIYKWKGFEDSFTPQRLEHLASLQEALRGTPWEASVSEPVSEVVAHATELQRRADSAKAVQRNLKQALKSAQSKYPKPSEIASESDDPETALAEYVATLEREMLEDAEGDAGFAAGVKPCIEKELGFRIRQLLQKSK